MAKNACTFRVVATDFEAWTEEKPKDFPATNRGWYAAIEHASKHARSKGKQANVILACGGEALGVNLLGCRKGTCRVIDAPHPGARKR